MESKIFKISVILSVIFFCSFVIATKSVRITSNLSNFDALKNPNSRIFETEKNDINKLFDRLSSENLSGSPKSKTNLSIDSNGITEYAIRLRAVVLEEFVIKQEYSGMFCSVFISLTKDGKIQSLEVKEGDKQLCNDVINHLDNIKLPPAPNDKVYQAVKNNLFLRFDF